MNECIIHRKLIKIEQQSKVKRNEKKRLCAITSNCCQQIQIRRKLK